MIDSFPNNASGPRKKRAKEESEVAGFFVFSHIRVMGCFRLG